MELNSDSLDDSRDYEDLVYTVLENNSFRCTESNRDIKEECDTAYIRYKEPVESFDNMEDAREPDNLEIVCEEYTEADDDLFREIRLEGENTADGLSRFAENIEELIIEHSITEIGTKNKLASALLFALVFTVLLFVGFLGSVREELMFIGIPLASVGVGVLFLFEKYTTELHKGDEENELLINIGVYIGILSSISATALMSVELLEITTYTPWSETGQLLESFGSAGLFTQILSFSILGIIIGCYSFYKLLLNDDTELLIKSTSNEVQKNNEKKLENPDYDVKFQSFNPYKRQFVAVILSVSFIFAVGSLIHVTTFYTFAFLTIIMPLPAIYYMYYMYKRNKWYNSLQ